MRLLVSGGRDFDDIEFIVKHLTRLHNSRSITELVHGAARGVDSICGYWAEESGIKVTPVPAKWNDEFGNFNKRAGFDRNQLMLDVYKPDALIAFPGGGGTADMVSRAEKVLQEVWQSSWVYFNSRSSTVFQFLSNMAEGFGFADDDGIWWPTSEHYYQAMKSPMEEEQQYIRESANGYEAKKRGKEINTTTDWDQRRLDVMKKALSYKFAKGTEAAGLLQDTSIDYLVEYAPWGDTFWGINKDKQGHNHLGRLLMEQRDTIS